MQKSSFRFFFSLITFAALTGVGIFVSSIAPHSQVAMSLDTTENDNYGITKFHVVNLSSTSFASDEKIRELEAKMPRLEADKPFYHWTKAEVGIRWILQGSIDPGEMSFYNTPTGDRQVYGAGLYLAETPSTSTSFGAFPVAFVMKKGTMIYNDDVSRSVFGRVLSHEEVNELGRQVPFVRDLRNGSGWFMTYQSVNTTGVEYAGRLGTKLDSNKIASFQDFVPLYEAGTANGRGNEYLENLFFLMKYLDGISFMAAMETNPGNPQDVFEPEHFERFKQVYKKLLPRISYENTSITLRQTGSKAVIHDLGISSSTGNFGDGKSNAATWAKNQAENILPQIYRNLEGTNDQNSYRSEGIHAGGTDSGGTFYISLINAGHLKMNSYIETNLQMTADRTGFNASYSYPDALHFKQLKDKLSPALFNELSQADSSDLMSNHSKRQEFNRRIVHELLIELFTRYHGKNINYKDPSSVGFLDELMSIHPFPDKNGRTARLYFDIAHQNSRNSPPLFPLGDLDLIMSKEFLAENLESATPIHQEIMEEYLSEFLTASREHRTPDFAKLGLPFSQRPHAKILGMFASLGTLPSIEIKRSHLALIQQRKFDQVFNDWFGKNWEIADLNSVHESLAYFKDKPEIEKLVLGEIFRPSYIASISLRQQAALLQLVSQRKLGVPFLKLIAENSGPHVIASMVPLIQEMLKENPKVFQDPSFLKVVEIVARNPETHEPFFRMMFENPWAENEVGRVLRAEWLKSRVAGTHLHSQFMPIFASSPWSHKLESAEFLIEVAKSGLSGVLAAISQVDASLPLKYFESSSGVRLVHILLEQTLPADAVTSVFLQKRISDASESLRPVYRKMAVNRVLQGNTSPSDIENLFKMVETIELPMQMDVRRIYQMAFATNNKVLLRGLTETLFKQGMAVRENRFAWSILLNLMKTQDPEWIDLSWSKVRLLPLDFFKSKASDQAFEIVFKFGSDSAKTSAAALLPRVMRAGEDPGGPRFTKLYELIKGSSSQVRMELFILLGKSTFIRSAKAQELMDVLLDPEVTKGPEFRGEAFDGVLQKLASLSELQDKPVSDFILKLARVHPEIFAPPLFEGSASQAKMNLDLFLRLGEYALQSPSPQSRAKTYATFSQFMISPVHASADQNFSFLEHAFKNSDFEPVFLREIASWRSARPVILSWSQPRFAQLMLKLIPKMTPASKAGVLLEDNSAISSQIGSNLLAEFIESDQFSQSPDFLNKLNSLRGEYRRELGQSPYYPRILRAISMSKVPGIRTQFASDIQKYGVSRLSCEDVFITH